MKLAMREAMIGFRRAPLLSALSVTTIGFSLFAFGLFSLVAHNLRNTLKDVESRVEIRAFIAEGSAVEPVADAMGVVGDYPEVLRVEYVSPEQALERAKRDLGEFQDVFEGNFLPGSLDIRLREGYRDPATVRRIADSLRTLPFVDDVRYGEEWVDKLYRIRNIAAASGVVLGLAFAGVAVIIIGATIRMAVLARSREISIMRLVGATDSFIRRPFLIEGFLKGILGGVLALLFTWVASSLISRAFIQTDFFPVSLAALGVLGGAVIGVLGSALSVGRHLRRV
ncbi:MAG TPA: permease-like cell division protein FtsX [Gemmatimonadaceae bacterium]|nr:permease-like cell division protein FtsX [Gemmatimonadaceae bacterium]